MNEIKRLIETTAGNEIVTSEGAPVADMDLPRQSFRIIGGVSAAHATVSASTECVIEKVAVVSIRDGKYIAAPIRDAPIEGYAINENGDDAEATRVRVIALLGPNAHLTGSVWAQALIALDAGRNVMFVLSKTSVEMHGKRVFPVRIQ